MDNEALDSEGIPETENPPDAGVLQPIVPLREDIVPKENKSASTPASVRIAALLVTAHGIAIALNALYGGRNTGDMSGLPSAVIWLGVTIVLAGALCERQAWAWWVIAVFGGLVGIFNVMKVAAFSIYQANGVMEDNHSFSPVLAGAAGVAMLLAVTLLMMLDAKAAFGMAKDKPGGLFK